MAGPPKRKPIRTLRQTKNVCSPGIDGVKASVTYLSDQQASTNNVRSVHQPRDVFEFRITPGTI